jgi:hypothetical protein
MYGALECSRGRSFRALFLQGTRFQLLREMMLLGQVEQEGQRAMRKEWEVEEVAQTPQTALTYGFLRRWR